MKNSKSLFGRLNNEVRRNSADKAMAFHRSSLRENALPQNARRPKPLCISCAISVKNQCKSAKSVAKIQLVRHSFSDGGSIKMNKLCKTNPIYKSREIKLTLCPTMTNNQKL
jgi:hypothetical protein